MATYCTTKAAIAREFEVSPRTVTEWTRSRDFPRQTKRGWNRAKIDAWCKERGAGPYHARRIAPDAQDQGEPGNLTEANIRLKREQAENWRIKKERQLVEQALELQQILLRHDVAKINSQMIASVHAVVDAVADARDRELPEKCPSAKQWKKLRRRMLEMDAKLLTDIHSAMEELIAE